VFRAHPDYKAWKWVGVKDGISADEAEGLPRMFLNTDKVNLWLYVNLWWCLCACAREAKASVCVRVLFAVLHAVGS